MRIGIVGAEGAKFTSYGEQQAKELIRRLLSAPYTTLVSGHCHLGGIDIWAEEIAKELNCFNPDFIFAPKALNWSGGYAPRNRLIASRSDIVHNITVRELPLEYKGMTFKGCYHCKDDRPPHVKSGGCWTAKHALRYGNRAEWHIIPNYRSKE